MKNSRFWEKLKHAWRTGEEVEFNIDISFETVVTIIVGLIAVVWLLLKS